MADEDTAADASCWAAAMLDCAFKKRNPIPCPQDPLARALWRTEVPVTPAEHPLHPTIVGAVEKR